MQLASLWYGVDLCSAVMTFNIARWWLLWQNKDIISNSGLETTQPLYCARSGSLDGTMPAPPGCPLEKGVSVWAQTTVSLGINELFCQIQHPVQFHYFRIKHCLVISFVYTWQSVASFSKREKDKKKAHKNFKKLLTSNSSCKTTFG